jgi:hypothetical protein
VAALRRLRRRRSGAGSSGRSCGGSARRGFLLGLLLEAGGQGRRRARFGSARARFGSALARFGAAAARGPAVAGHGARARRAEQADCGQAQGPREPSAGVERAVLQAGGLRGGGLGGRRGGCGSNGSGSGIELCSRWWWRCCSTTARGWGWRLPLPLCLHHARLQQLLLDDDRASSAEPTCAMAASRRATARHGAVAGGAR